MTRGARIAVLAGLGILVLGLVLAQFAAAPSGGERPSGPSPEDPGPGGLLGLVLLLEGNGQEVERLGAPPSEADLKSDGTTLAVDPGSLTAADANALHALAEAGGRVVLAGDVGSEGFERITGTPIEMSAGGGAATAAPLAPTPETSEVASVSSAGTASISEAGGALPVLGSGEAAMAVVASVEAGRVVVLADPSTLTNEHLVSMDNARFALNIAGGLDRPVQLVERVQTTPSAGLGALPEEWVWAFLGMFLASLAFAAAHARRLGPPELESRPLAPARREYVDAMAAALLRSRDPAAAARPLRKAALDRLERGYGSRPDAVEDVARAAAAAGLEPEEVAALTRPSEGEDEMLAVARALAKLSGKT